MQAVTHHLEANLYFITLNRPQVSNAFDDETIQQLQSAVEAALADTHAHVLILKGEGKHFSAGADLNWMKRMAKASEAENKKDALQLTHLLHTLKTCPKPLIAQVHGATYGGGLGLIAACDIAIAAQDARFCFSEVKLGLIPAVISPYILQAMPARLAKAYFMTGDVFTAQDALTAQLIHEVVPIDTLAERVKQRAEHLAALPQEALQACKGLVQTVSGQPLNHDMMMFTAELIAKKRGSEEAQRLMGAFLASKET